MDRSSLPATNDPHIHNGTRDHTAKCVRAETSWIKGYNFYKLYFAIISHFIVHYPSYLPMDDVKAKPELAILFWVSIHYYDWF